MPYPFHTPILINWQAYAETEKGKTFQFMQKVTSCQKLSIRYIKVENSISDEPEA